jgi:hypothetical protein
VVLALHRASREVVLTVDTIAAEPFTVSDSVCTAFLGCVEFVGR